MSERQQEEDERISNRSPAMGNSTLSHAQAQEQSLQDGKRQSLIICSCQIWDESEHHFWLGPPRGRGDSYLDRPSLGGHRSYIDVHNWRAGLP